MKSVFKSVLLSVLLAGAGFSAFAKTPAAGAPCDMMGAGGPMHEGMGHRKGAMDPAQMQAKMDKHHAALKAKLKLTPAQEGAWTTFIAAMKPPAAMMANRPDHAELSRLPTPERIDKMKALRAQRMGEMSAAMEQRGEAIKAFYATLTPEQQKMFDADTAHHAGHHGGKTPKPAAATK